jgi:hypothetical protein
LPKLWLCPGFPAGLPCPAAVLGLGAIAPGLCWPTPIPPAPAPEDVPQIPASLFAFAILARSGPLLTLLLCTPAFDEAVDHKLPKASAPAPVDALATGLPSVAAEVEEEYEGLLLFMFVAGWEENAVAVEALLLMDVLTEVK